MCGTNSRWLGPVRRKAEHGSETAGTPRHSGAQQKDLERFATRKGWGRGARTR